MFTKKRNKENNIVSRIITEMSDNLKYDSRGELFLFHDIGFHADERIIIFSSKFKENFIVKTKGILIDGTFRSTPPGFSQTFILHGEYFGCFYPIFYILLKDKAEITYTKAIELCFPMFESPQYIICDYEVSLINAIKRCFREVNVNGCMFHLGQAFCRKIQSFGAASSYKQDESFTQGIKFLLLLSFVPKQDVVDAFISLKVWIRTNCILECDAMISYFERNYIGVINANGETTTPPRYDVAFWSVHDRVVNGVARSTNAAESYHRTLNLRTNVAHPNIAMFLSEILGEEETDMFNLERACKGKFDLPNNLKKEKSLQTLLKNYRYMALIDFLIAIGKIYKFKFEINE